MNIPPLSWAAFVLLAAAIAAGAFVKTDFHSVSAVLSSAVVACTGVAGICLHPPWAPAPSPPNPTVVEVKHESQT